MSISVNQPRLAVPGRGLDGFFSVAKHSITTLTNMMVAIVTQSSSVTNLTPRLNPTKIMEISRRKYLEDTLNRAKEQPQQMFQTSLQTINAANDEPSVIAAKQAASSFETAASHNFMILVVCVAVVAYLIYRHSDTLFSPLSRKERTQKAIQSMKEVIRKEQAATSERTRAFAEGLQK